MTESTPTPESDLHEIDPARFEEEVHSFAFWFDAVEGYLAGQEYGHRPGAPEPALEPRDRERLVTALCSYCVGETAALDGASGLVAIAPNRQSKIFLATQAVDEARHLEVLLHRLRDLGIERPEEEIARRASPSLRRFEQRLRELVRSGDWCAALFAQNVILEAMEFTAFRAHAQHADEKTREILEGIVKDERRHMGFGENDLGRRLATDDSLRRRLIELRRELDPLVLDTFERTMEDLGVARGERPDVGRSYLEAIARLGFPQ
jgi:1,2-phenylacetyl-CoA epoxidase catalytic subunit